MPEQPVAVSKSWKRRWWVLVIGYWVSAWIVRPTKTPRVIYPIQNHVRSRNTSDKGDDEEPIGVSKSHAAHPILVGCPHSSD